MTGKWKRARLTKRTIFLGNWNVQGLTRKMNKVIYKTERLNVNISVVKETKKGHISEKLGKYDLFYSGVPKEKRAELNGTYL